jgi:hypothetical protein
VPLFVSPVVSVVALKHFSKGNVTVPLVIIESHVLIVYSCPVENAFEILCKRLGQIIPCNWENISVARVIWLSNFGCLTCEAASTIGEIVLKSCLHNSMDRNANVAIDN